MVGLYILMTRSHFQANDVRTCTYTLCTSKIYRIIFGTHLCAQRPKRRPSRFPAIMSMERGMKKNDKVFPIYDRVPHLEQPGAWVSLWLFCLSICDVQRRCCWSHSGR